MKTTKQPFGLCPESQQERLGHPFRRHPHPRSIFTVRTNWEKIFEKIKIFSPRLIRFNVVQKKTIWHPDCQHSFLEQSGRERKPILITVQMENNHMKKVALGPNAKVRKNDIVCFLYTYHVEHRYMPNIREIGNAVRIPSTSVTNYYLDQLKKQGW